MKKIWKIKEHNRDIVEQLCREMKVDNVTAVLLNVRGINNREECEKYFYPEMIRDFHNPFLLKDMEKAVERVRKAFDENEKICIYGDRDVDGVSGAVMLYRALEKCKAQVDVSVPEGDDGYGLNMGTIDSFHESGCGLVITVDNGITSFDAIKKANEYNMDVIVIDHHTPEEARLPDAYAIINPKCEKSYEIKEK